MLRHETVRPATQGQFKEVSAALILAIPDMSFAEMQKLVRRKRVWARKVSEILREVSGFYPVPELLLLDPWQEFYRDIFGIEKDFSSLVDSLAIPTHKDGFDRLIVVLAGMTPNRLFAKCKELFPAWRYTEDLDQIKSDREPDHDYSIWVRDRVEADEELKNLSANNTKARGVVGITLPERLLYELKYFMETGKHLDLKNITLCTGSRGPGACVPGVDWRGGDLSVGWGDPDSRSDGIRVRPVVP